jgi:type VI secretion system protein ImpC
MPDDKAQAQTGQAAAPAEAQDLSPLDKILQTVNVSSDEAPAVIEILDSYIQQITKAPAAALPKIDKALFEERINFLDQMIGAQLDEILHSAEFQQVESAWRSLYFLVDRTDWQQKNVGVQILNVSKDELAADFANNEITETGLYKHLYHKEYDQLGGDPISVMVSNFEFNNSADDLDLLGNIARVAASVHCPFLGAVGAEFFGVKSIEDLNKIPNLDNLFEQKKFMKWNSFRDRSESRFVGMTFPRFLLRKPHEPSKRQSFSYKEDVKGTDSSKYLWGSSAFSLATNMIHAFQKFGWPVQIRGPKAGGMVDDLPYDVDEDTGDTKLPTEMLIPDHKELKYSNCGFIPFINEKGRNRACFYSANSVQRAKEYDDAAATATSKAMTRLPYMLLASRIAHYLKVQQRDNIGANKTRAAIEDELNTWINTLVCKMDNPDPKLISERPLRDAAVTVEPIEDNPGWYDVGMTIVPHFSIEGLKVRLALMAQMPGAKK